jgi:hypothetical protein
VVSFGAILALTGAVRAQTIAPEFAGFYAATDLGAVPGLPPSYGGLTFKHDDPNVVIIGGNANTADGALYSVRVLRDMDNHIIGFDGMAEFFAEGQYNDGGVAYHPGSNVLFTSRWPVNQMGQVKPGSSTTDKIIDLAPFGVVDSNASVNFVPFNFPGQGRMKIASWSGGEWYDVEIAPDGVGTFDITSVTAVPGSTLPGGPEGFTYVPLGSPIFGNSPTMIVSEYGAGMVAVYDMDANGDPIVASRRTFISDLVGAEGAAIDPLTGDFIFSTFGDNDRVIRVSGFAIPGAATAPLLALAGLGLARRRR